MLTSDARIFVMEEIISDDKTFQISSRLTE